MAHCVGLHNRVPAVLHNFGSLQSAVATEYINHSVHSWTQCNPSMHHFISQHTEPNFSNGFHNRVTGLYKNH